MYNYVTREQQNTFGYHLQPKFRKIGSKNCDLLDLFEEGIAKEKLHKIELRKDAMMLLRIKQKYDIISQHFAKYKDNTYAGHKKPKFPVIKLNNGDNLLMYPPDEMYQFYEVYEIFLEELQNCNISFFGALPNLHKLSIRFSNISLMDEKEYLSMPRYVNLRELNLNCNRITTLFNKLCRYIKAHSSSAQARLEPDFNVLQECYKDLGYKEGDFPVAEKLAKRTVCLPIYPELTDEEIEYVIDGVNSFERVRK